MTAVKDQSTCGSCWSFCGTSVLEGAASIARSAAAGKFVPPVQLSEQQGLDCTRGNCEDGGWMYYLWEHGLTKGINLASDYPYTGKDAGRCRNEQYTPDVKVTGYQTVAETWMNENSNRATVKNIRAALEKGPLTVSGDAYSDLFLNYDGGIMDSTMGCPTELNHAMTLVGYEVEGTQDTVITSSSKDHCEMIEVTTEVVTDAVEETKCRRASYREFRRENRCYRNRRLPPNTEEYLVAQSRYRAYCCYDVMGEAEVEYVTETIMDPDCEAIETVTTIPGEPEMGVWVIQNSWGPSWGENGFIRVEAKDEEGVCGLNFWTQAVQAEDWE